MQMDSQVAQRSLLLQEVDTRPWTGWALDGALALHGAFGSGELMTTASTLQLTKMAPFVHHTHELNVSSLAIKLVEKHYTSYGDITHANFWRTGVVHSTSDRHDEVVPGNLCSVRKRLIRLKNVECSGCFGL